MSGSRIIKEGKVAGVDGSPNFSSIKIFLPQVRQSCKSRPDWKPVTLETVAKPQNKKNKDPKQETLQSLSVLPEKKLSRML